MKVNTNCKSIFCYSHHLFPFLFCIIVWMAGDVSWLLISLPFAFGKSQRFVLLQLCQADGGGIDRAPEILQHTRTRIEVTVFFSSTPMIWEWLAACGFDWQLNVRPAWYLYLDKRQHVTLISENQCYSWSTGTYSLKIVWGGDRKEQVGLRDRRKVSKSVSGWE